MKITAKKIFIAIIVIVLLIFLIVEYYKSQEFDYTGTVEATKIDIASQLASVISRVNVYEGDRVTSNQSIVVLDCPDVKFEAELAATNFARNFSLFNVGTVSQDTLDQFKNTKDISQVKLSWCNITSPIIGTVLNRYHEPGDLALPGTKLLTLANIKDVYAYIYIPQTELANVKIGQKLKATLPELDDKVFIGTVIKVSDEAEFTPKNVQTKKERERLVYGIKVSFLGSNDEEILKPGMTIYVDSLEPVNK